MEALRLGLDDDRFLVPALFEDEIGINLFAYITCGGEQVKVTLMKTLGDDEQCNNNQYEY